MYVCKEHDIRGIVNDTQNCRLCQLTKRVEELEKKLLKLKDELQLLITMMSKEEFNV